MKSSYRWLSTGFIPVWHYATDAYIKYRNVILRNMFYYQDCSNYIAGAPVLPQSCAKPVAMELPQSCTNPSICKQNIAPLYWIMCCVGNGACQLCFVCFMFKTSKSRIPVMNAGACVYWLSARSVVFGRARDPSNCLKSFSLISQIVVTVQHVIVFWLVASVV